MKRVAFATEIGGRSQLTIVAYFTARTVCENIIEGNYKVSI